MKPQVIVLAALILIVVPLVISRFSKALITAYDRRRDSRELLEPETIPVPVGSTERGV